MDNPVEEIKKRLDIVDFIGSFITLKKTGRNFKALCPFHPEKTPSFIISPDRQIWHCFGACQDGGDVIKFLMKWENITFFEALKELAEKTGVKLIRKFGLEDQVWKKKERLAAMNLLATEFFEFILNKTNFGKKALLYLNSRDIKTSTIKKFQLGYAPASWNSLRHFLKKKKYEEEEMFEGGLLVKGEKGSFYDRFRGRLIFPIKDTRNNIIGFSGRALIDDGSAKYINTPETPLYHKRETLYGINLAKESIKKEKNVFVVEGEFDVISPYQQGLTNFVAIKGSALTREQLMLLKRYANKVTLALDTDAAGETAVKKGIEEAEKLDLEVGIVNFDFAKDPDEAVHRDLNSFKKILKNPIPIYDFIIAVSQRKYPDDNPFSKKKVGEEVIPYIEKINNPIVQSYYIKKLAEVINVSESSIEILIRKERQRKKQPYRFFSQKKKTVELEREFLIQRYVLSLVFQNEDPYKAAEKIFSILSPADFSYPSYQKICQAFLGLKESSLKKFSLEKFSAGLPDELQPVFDEIYLFASSELGFENEQIDKLAYEIKRFYLKRKITEVLSSSFEGDDKNGDLSTLTKKLKEVEKKLITL